MPDQDPSNSGVSTLPVILGTSWFCRRVRRALDLLRRRAPEEYDLVLAYVGRIVMGSCGETGAAAQMRVDTDPPTMELTRWIVSRKKAFCAAVLVHEAWHSKLHSEHLERGGPALDPVEQERICIAAQLRVLRHLRGRSEDIALLELQDGTHCLRKGPPNWLLSASMMSEAIVRVFATACMWLVVIYAFDNELVQLAALGAVSYPALRMFFGRG